MPDTPHLIRTSVNVLLVRDGKVLLSRRKNTGWADGMLCIPGGHVDKGERPSVAAARETQEELGITFSAEELIAFCVASRNTEVGEYVAYEFYAELGERELINAEPNLCSELVWVDPANLPEDVITDFEQIITKGYLGKKTYLEIGY